MATAEKWIDCYLNRPVKVQYVEGNIFSGDNDANIFGVNVYNADGTPATLTGTVSANIIKTDGTTSTANGSKSGNKASVSIPAAALATPGTLIVVLKITNSGVVTGLGSIVTNVYSTTYGNTIDPGNIMPSIESLLMEIDSVFASIPADYSSLWGALAPTFAEATANAVNSYVTYNGHLYLLPGGHAANTTWANTTKTQVTVGGQLSDLKSAITKTTEGSKNLLPIESKSSTVYTVVRSYADGILESSGTANDGGGRNSAITPNFTLPAGTYTFSKVVVSGPARALYIVFTDDSSYETLGSDNASITFTISSQRTAFISAGYSNNSGYTLTYKLQLEAGSSATAFVEPSFMSAVDFTARALSTETAGQVATLVETVDDMEEDLSNVQTAVEKGIKVSKNLLPVESKSSTVYTVVRNYADGVIKSSGTSNDSGGRNSGFTPNFTLPAGTYTISKTVVSGSKRTLYIVFTDDSSYETYPSDDASKTFTLVTQRTMFISTGYSNNAAQDYEYLLQIESGSTATAYEAPSSTTAIDKVARDVLTHVKVMSYNVGSYNDGASRDFTPEEQAQITEIYRQFFNDQNCDIIGLQEAKTNFSTGNPVNPAIYNPLYPEYSDSTNTSSVKSRFKFKEKGTYDISTDTGDNRHCAYGVCDIAGHEVYVVTVHFSPYSAAYREDNYAELINILNQHEYFICFGDFNCRNDPTEYQPFITAGYNIANCNYVGVLNTMKGAIGSNTPIPNDNIVTSSNIMITGIKVLSDLANTLKSDHLPIVADLVFNVG